MGFMHRDFGAEHTYGAVWDVCTGVMGLSMLMGRYRVCAQGL